MRFEQRAGQTWFVRPPAAAWTPRSIDSEWNLVRLDRPGIIRPWCESSPLVSRATNPFSLAEGDAQPLDVNRIEFDAENLEFRQCAGEVDTEPARVSSNDVLAGEGREERFGCLQSTRAPHSQATRRQASSRTLLSFCAFRHPLSQFLIALPQNRRASSLFEARIMANSEVHNIDLLPSAFAGRPLVSEEFVRGSGLA